MLSIVNNSAALNAENNLNNSNNALNTSLQRLSSGLRINSGADDPAGLVTSQEQLAQMSGLQTAITNTSTATNVVQIADGALNETNSLLLQIRGLAVSAANTGANDTTSLAADQAQITNALQTINSIATTTRFGSTTLLDGSHAGTASAATSDNTTGVTATATSSATPGTYTISNVTLAKAATVEGSLTNTYSSTGNAALAVGQKETFTITDSSGHSANVNLDNTSGTSALTVQNVINSINTATGNGATVGVTASFDSTTGQIKLTSSTTGSSAGITVSGDSLTGTLPSGTGLTTNANFGANATAATLSGSITYANASATALTSSQSETFTIADGSGHSANVSLNTSSPTTLTVQNVIDAINTAASGGSVGVTASLSGGQIKLTSTATGSSAGITISSESVTGGPAGTGFTNTAVTGADATAGTLSGSATYANTSSAALNAGQKETLAVSDGTHSANVVLDNTTGTSALTVQDVINSINTATDNGSTVGVTASFSGGHIVLTSATTGSGAEANVTSDAVTNPGGTGFTNAGSATTGTDISAKVNGTTVTGTGNTLTAATGLTFAVDPTTYSTSGGTNGNTVITVGASNALVFQIGANAGDTASLSIASALSSALGQNAAPTPGSGETQNQFANLSLIDVTQNASDAINVVDKAISDVSSLQGNLGAFQDNTLQATAANLQTSLQNTTAADSTIRDTDFASETANYTQDQVLVQAGTQVLKNANQIPQLVLSLIQQ